MTFSREKYRMKNAKKFILFGWHDLKNISSGCWKLFDLPKHGMLPWKRIFSSLKRNKIMICEHWWDFYSNQSWNVRREEVCLPDLEQKLILGGQNSMNYWNWLCKKILPPGKLASSGMISIKLASSYQLMNILFRLLVVYG